MVYLLRDGRIASRVDHYPKSMAPKPLEVGLGGPLQLAYDGLRELAIRLELPADVVARPWD